MSEKPRRTKKQRETNAQYIMNRMVVEASGCWRWTGSTTGGYGQCNFLRGERRAHRLAYRTFVGPIPEGLVLDHLCRNRSCVNPSHLEPVTNQTNVLRGTGSTAERARMTHCREGHPLERNPYRTSRNERWCRICQNQRKALSKQRLRAQKKEENRAA